MRPVRAARCDWHPLRRAVIFKGMIATFRTPVSIVNEHVCLDGCVGGRSRLAKMKLEQWLLKVLVPVSRDGRWGWDGACLESVSGSCVDPISYKGGMNLYEYVRDDPTNATDPSGLDTYFQRRKTAQSLTKAIRRGAAGVSRTGSSLRPMSLPARHISTTHIVGATPRTNTAGTMTKRRTWTPRRRGWMIRAPSGSTTRPWTPL